MMDTMFDPPGAQPELLARFAKTSLPRALWQLVSSLLPFAAGWYLMAYSWIAGWNYGWTLLLALPTPASTCGCS